VVISDNITAFNLNVFEGSRNLTQIRIGPNVDIQGTDLMAYYNFWGAYMGNSRMAGTYTFSDGRWTRR